MERNKIGQRNPEHWGSYSQYKPKKWRVINGKKKIYSAMVEVYKFDTFWPQLQLGFIDIEYHVLFDHTTNLRKIDEVKLKSDLDKKFPGCDFEISIGDFIRDRALFPFILRLETINVDLFLKSIEKEKRLKKFKNLMNF